MVSAAPSVGPSSSTMESMKRNGLAAWLANRLFLRTETNSAAETNDRTALSAEGETLWGIFQNTDKPLSLSQYERLGEELAQSVVASSHRTGNNIVVPTKPTHHAASPPEVLNQTIITLPSSDEKQQRFFTALYEFQTKVLPTAAIPADSCFLACGTALGMVRDRQFIAHDKDIDVGLFYDDLCRLSPHGDGQEAVLRFLAVLADGSTPAAQSFFCFDVCGEITKGLELRLIHRSTGTLLDVNLYYPPLPSDSPSVSGTVKRTGAGNENDREEPSFVWTATHLEESGKRKHGMYRYRHAPFATALQAVLLRGSLFVGDATEGGRDRIVDAPLSALQRESTLLQRELRVLVPPISYLEEYFGSDWRTPRQYSYEEAVRDGLYRNIIEE